MVPYTARNHSLVEAARSGRPVADLVRDFGLTRNTVKNILKRHGVEPIKKRGGFSKLLDQQPTDLLLEQLGRDVCTHRMITMRKSVSEAAPIFGLSKTRLAMVEKGLYQLSWMELNRIAQVLGRDLSDLLKRRSKTISLDGLQTN